MSTVQSQETKNTDWLNVIFNQYNTDHNIKQWIMREWKQMTEVDWHDMAPDANCYNTAWVATLYEEGRPIFPDAITWLANHQLDDGSWGSPAKVFFDQMLATFMTVYALNKTGQHGSQVEAGIEWIEQNFLRLFDDREIHNGIAFAILMPSIYRYVTKEVELDLPQKIIDRWLAKWKEKLLYLNIDEIMSEKNHLAYTFEFLCGLDYEMYDIDMGVLIQANGAMTNSEAATAFAISICDDEKLKTRMFKYLKDSQRPDGGWTSFSNLDAFNLCFLLYPIAKVSDLVPSEYHQEVREMLIRIRDNGHGIPMGRYWYSPDGDDTIMALLLAYLLDLVDDNDPVFEQLEYFNVTGIWYELYRERYGAGTSRKLDKDEDRYAISINLHVYDVLSEIQSSYADSVTDRLRDAFRQAVNEEGMGTDRWHISPAYNNCHAIFAFAKDDPELAKICASWFMNEQNSSGLWGKVVDGTAFELSSFAVLALSYFHEHVEKIDLQILDDAVNYILRVDTSSDSLTPIWLDKVLYRPDFFIGTAIAALLQYSKVKSKEKTRS